MYTPEAADDAFDRVEDFATLNLERDAEEKQEAISLVFFGLGVDHKAWEQLTERMNLFVPPESQGAAMLGIMLGLFMAQSDK